MSGSGEAHPGRSTIRVVGDVVGEVAPPVADFLGDVPATARRREVGRLRRHGAAVASVGRF